MNKKTNYICPCSEKVKLEKVENTYLCKKVGCIHSTPQAGFPIISEKPVIISEIKCDTVCSANNIKSYVKRQPGKLSYIKKILLGESSTTKANCNIFIERLKKVTSSPKILIIGSAEKGSGTEKLWEDPNINIHGVDIYNSDFTDTICDAHYLPFENESFDGVWIQAVLEHVVDPKSVVNEIYRVLKPQGVVYAETPFMQQVHEGAYDFTRYTVLGHRYLFKRFEAIDFGGNKGPEVVLAWAFRYFVWSITRSRKLARIVGLLCGLMMRPFVFLTSSKSLHDASSGVFFLGHKSANHDLSHKDLVKLYQGQF